MSIEIRLPLIARGKVIEDATSSVHDQIGEVNYTISFPDPAPYLETLLLRDPRKLEDMASTPVDEIIAFLVEVGSKLQLESNAYLQDAWRYAATTSGLSEPVLRSVYLQLPTFFTRDNLERTVENKIGKRYLDGWVDREGGPSRTRLRAFGTRCVHIIAGNGPVPAAMTILRSALAKCDAIIKAPGNELGAAFAIVKTMLDVDREHVVSKHIAVAYWPSSHREFEKRLYDPRYVDKAIVWGGIRSAGYLKDNRMAGLDVIAIEPKASASVIGHEAFLNTAEMKSVAEHAALDVASFGGAACSSSRVIYVECGRTPGEMAKLREFGAEVFQHMRALLPSVSSCAVQVDAELERELNAIRFQEDEYRVIGDARDGAVIISQNDRVDFFRRLSSRVVNIVPIRDVSTVHHYIDKTTQTVGVYPSRLEEILRDSLCLAGVQRVVPLGHAVTVSDITAIPHDGLEPMRQSVRWAMHRG